MKEFGFITVVGKKEDKKCQRLAKVFTLVTSDAERRIRGGEEEEKRNTNFNLEGV